MEAVPSQPARPPDALARCHALLREPMRAVEESLEETIHSTVQLIPEVSRHLIGSGGKRIRPVLLLLCAKASGGDERRGVGLAVATELFHSATLLHDDVVDRGHLRRGVTAAPQVYGNSASVLVGDFLLSRAFSLVVGHGDLRLLDELSRVLTAMAEGEVLQLIRSGRLTVSLPDYVQIISGKTAGLFSWACRAGTSLGTVDVAGAAAEFGRELGMAFQIADDILDYAAPSADSGKDVANDLLQGKTTLPLLLACETDPSLLGLVESVAAAGPDQASCRPIVERVLASGAIDSARQEAQRHADRAVARLSDFPDGPLRKCLAELADFVVRRAD